MKSELNHIVYVDDEEDILQIATLCLESVGGFKVTPCENGERGYQAALQENPDLILLDVMMPVMDGPATLQKIRENPALSHIPIIFMTARVQPEDVRKYIELGAIGVVEKPFDPMGLSEQILALWKSC